MLDRPKPLAVLRAFALPAAAAALAAGAILWPSRAWIGKTVALLVAGALMVGTEVPRSHVRGTTMRGPSLAIAIVSAAGIVLLLAAVAIGFGAPSVRILPAALVLIAWQVVARLGDGGLVVRSAVHEGVLALVVVLVVIGAEELRRFEVRVGSRPAPEVAVPLDTGLPAEGDGGGAATPEPYAQPDPNLPAVFGGTPGEHAEAGGSSGSCPEELTEENTALLWMRLHDRRGEGVALVDEEEHKPAVVVPRRLHCACAPQRSHDDVFLAYCGRTRELCQAEAGSRASTGGCSVVAIGIGRRVDCALELRGVSAVGDDTSVTVGVRTVVAASKLVPQWTTLDAQALSRGRVLPIRVQRLRWARASTAQVDWRATNLTAAPRALAALGRALARTGMRCQAGKCERGDGSVKIDLCAGTNEVRAPSKGGN